jgi:hypothetical protein
MDLKPRITKHISRDMLYYICDSYLFIIGTVYLRRVVWEMTAHCPKCGGRWEVEGLKDINPDADHRVSICAGDNVEIQCYLCNTVIGYVINRKQLIEFHRDDLAELSKIIEDAGL